MVNKFYSSYNHSVSSSCREYKQNHLEHVTGKLDQTDVSLITDFTFMLPCCIVTNFFLHNQPDAPIIQIYFVMKLYMFRAYSLSIIRIFLLYIRHWYVSWPYPSSQDVPSWLLGYGHQTCTKLTSAECTVENSWWWAEKMPETCRVLWQNKFFIFSASGWLFKKKLVTDCSVLQTVV